MRARYGGRSPDSRIILLADAFPAVSPPVACPVGVRPRSQWRVREGIAPSSRKRYLDSTKRESFPGIIIECNSTCQARGLLGTFGDASSG